MVDQHIELTEHVGVSPYRVDFVDQFQGHQEDGYGTWGTYAILDDAIAQARKITEDGIRECGSVENWDGMGDAGLVYDSLGKLIWNGVRYGRELCHPEKEAEDHVA
jgi:hypothetical protein